MSQLKSKNWKSGWGDWFWSCARVEWNHLSETHSLGVLCVPPVSKADVCLHPTDVWPACFGFIINATVFFMSLLVFPGSQGKPNTQIPQRRSEAQWAATDHAEISKLLGQIPMLTRIHVIAGGEHMLLCTLDVQRRSSRLYVVPLSLNTYTWLHYRLSGLTLFEADGRGTAYWEP